MTGTRRPATSCSLSTISIDSTDVAPTNIVDAMAMVTESKLKWLICCLPACRGWVKRVFCLFSLVVPKDQAIKKVAKTSRVVVTITKAQVAHRHSSWSACIINTDAPPVRQRVPQGGSLSRTSRRDAGIPKRGVLEQGKTEEVDQ